MKALNQENQQLREQLGDAQQQATTLSTERSSREEELARVRAQAEQGQQELGVLKARVLELEERLGTQERLVQELQKEQLCLQEERSTLAAQLEEQEVRGTAPGVFTSLLVLLPFSGPTHWNPHTCPS